MMRRARIVVTLAAVATCLPASSGHAADTAVMLNEVALAATLDEGRGYCLDVLGSQARATPERGLQAHTCYGYQGKIAVDQGFDASRLGAGEWRLPAFNVCMSATAAAGARLMLLACDGSTSQRFTLKADGTIVPERDTRLCITVGGGSSGMPGGGGRPVHLLRPLTLESCGAEQVQRQQWTLRKSLN